jgi:hypothetical protein
MGLKKIGTLLIKMAVLRSDCLDIIALRCHGVCEHQDLNAVARMEVFMSDLDRAVMTTVGAKLYDFTVSRCRSIDHITAKERSEYNIATMADLPRIVVRRYNGDGVIVDTVEVNIRNCDNIAKAINDKLSLPLQRSIAQSVSHDQLNAPSSWTTAHIPMLGLPEVTSAKGTSQRSEVIRPADSDISTSPTMQSHMLAINSDESDIDHYFQSTAPPTVESQLRPPQNGNTQLEAVASQESNISYLFSEQIPQSSHLFPESTSHPVMTKLNPPTEQPPVENINSWSALEEWSSEIDVRIFAQPPEMPLLVVYYSPNCKYCKLLQTRVNVGWTGEGQFDVVAYDVNEAKRFANNCTLLPPAVPAFRLYVRNGTELLTYAFPLPVSLESFQWSDVQTWCDLILDSR